MDYVTKPIKWNKSFHILTQGQEYFSSQPTTPKQKPNRVIDPQFKLATKIQLDANKEDSRKRLGCWWKFDTGAKEMQQLFRSSVSSTWAVFIVLWREAEGGTPTRKELPVSWNQGVSTLPQRRRKAEDVFIREKTLAYELTAIATS